MDAKYLWLHLASLPEWNFSDPVMCRLLDNITHLLFIMISPNYYKTNISIRAVCPLYRLFQRLVSPGIRFSPNATPPELSRLQLKSAEFSELGGEKSFAETLSRR